MIATTTLLLSFGLSAYAAPSSTISPSTQNGNSCNALQRSCLASVQSDLSDVWNIEACVFGAACFGDAQEPLDNFLSYISNEKGEHGPAPKSADLPRVSSSLFDSLSTDGTTISQQNFIDGFYSSLGKTGGPYPSSVDYVFGLYARIQDWTGFCSSSIPFQNFADYYQYSSNVDSSACSGSPTTTSAAAATSTAVVSPDASCEKLFTTCIEQVDQDVSDPWAVEACVLGATCPISRLPVNDFLDAVFLAKNPGSQATPPTSRDVPRLTNEVFDKISTDKKTWTQQDFVAAYYGTLSKLGGPFPSSVDRVIGYYDRILNWAGFCPGNGIPYMNVADYFQYSSSVEGGNAHC